MTKSRFSSVFTSPTLMRCLFFSTMSFFSFGSQPASAQTLTDGLVFLYNFSGDAADSSGNNIHGIVNGATLTADRFGNPNSAFYFDGVDDYLEIPNSSLIQVDYPVSFAMCVKPETLEQVEAKFMESEYVQSNYFGYSIGTGPGNTGNIGLSYGCGNGQTNPSNRRSKVSDSTLTIGQWHHVVGVIRGALDMDIYVDCQDAGGYYSGTGPNQVAHASVSGRFASLSGNPNTPINYSWCSLDQMAMWNRALTIGDVNKICDGELEPDLVSVSVEKEEDQGLSVRYSPSFDNIEVISNRNYGEVVWIELLTINGQLIADQKFDNQRSTLSVEGLSNGIYLVRIQSETNQFVNKISIVR